MSYDSNTLYKSTKVLIFIFHKINLKINVQKDAKDFIYIQLMKASI